MTIDAVGNTHRRSGAPGAGQFTGRANPRPAGDLTAVLEPDQMCTTHMGAWGADPTCENCTDGAGHPVTYPFPPLRDGLRAHEIDAEVVWRANPEGPSVVNPAGGVWHVSFRARSRDGSPGTVLIQNHALGRPPVMLNREAPTAWVLDSAPDWLRTNAVMMLRELTAEETRAGAAMAEATRREKEQIAAHGRRPARAAND